MDWRKFFRVVLAVAGGVALIVLALSDFDPNVLGRLIADDMLEAAIIDSVRLLSIFVLFPGTVVTVGVRGYEHKGNRMHVLLWSIFVAFVLASILNIISGGSVAALIVLAAALLPVTAYMTPHQPSRSALT